MALRLLKLNVEVTSTVDVNPVVTRFFYVTDEETAPGGTLTIMRSEFFDDTGEALTTELPSLEEDNSYYNVYVNGVLQMGDLSSFTPDVADPSTDPVLTIQVPLAGDGPLLGGTPIVLEVVNFEAASTPTVDT